MSTHRLKSTMQRGTSLPVRFVRSVRFVLGGVLILTALLLMLSSMAFASAFSAPSVGSQRNVDQAGVSVVRLVVTYTPQSIGNPLPTKTPSAPPSTQPTTCTGLGVLVSSEAATSSPGTNVWVLTDGNLVNPTTKTCNTGTTSVSTNAQLSQIQVLASNEYTNKSSAAFTIGTLAVRAGDVTCETDPCEQGLAVFGFSSPSLQPYIDLASSAPTTTAQEQGIELVNPTSSVLPTPLQAQQYLTPQAIPFTSAAQEPGMPFVDSNGSLVGMHLSSNASTPAPLNAITTLLNRAGVRMNPANALRENWDKGIAAYYGTPHNYAAAQTFFQNALKANPNFLAASSFKSLAASKAGSSGGAGNGGSENNHLNTNNANTIFGLPLILVMSVAALILLVVILLVVSMLMRNRRAKQHALEKFKEDEASAERRAGAEAQRISAMEAQQRQLPGQGRAPGPLSSPAPIGMPGMNAINGQVPAPVVGPIAQAPVQMSPIRELSCPQCGNAVPATAKVCPNCNTWLTPTDSGLHMRVNRQQGGAGKDSEAAMPFPPQPQPQFQSSSAPPYAQPGSPYPIDSQPTVPMSQDRVRNGQEDTDRTIPYNIQQVGNGKLGLVVGTQTNPGIKRKHKPNEDSLFAAQGAGMFSSSPQPFGLFVVADGMGGHANGQDASRLAIQTIIDYLLPRLTKGEELDRKALTQLLVEGVQQANQAVFRHNMELRADMGTTMTCALIVGSTAIVANVGDSRTYLYREPEGLRKVTNDHSVVASLVEAGIIKPDDIYTHPKRNQIYRSLGEKPTVEVDSFIVDLLPGDKLLLCSDGLWDMVRDPNIQQVLRNAAPNPNQTGEALIQAALDGGGEDNVSVIVVYVTETNQQTGISGLKLLAKPETVQMPQM